VRHAERSKTNENNHGLFEAGIYLKSPLACRMRVAFSKKATPLKECFKILRTLTPDNALRVAKVLCTFLLKNDPNKENGFLSAVPAGVVIWMVPLVF